MPYNPLLFSRGKTAKLSGFEMTVVTGAYDLNFASKIQG
jgi:hypothetical protein